MTLINYYEEDNLVFPDPPIFETDDILPVNLIRRKQKEKQKMANEKLKVLVDDLNGYLGKRHPVFKDKLLVYRLVYNGKKKVNENRILFDGNLIYSCEGQIDWQALLELLQKEAAVKNALHEMVSSFFKHADEKVMREKYGIEK